MLTNLFCYDSIKKIKKDQLKIMALKISLGTLLVCFSVTVDLGLTGGDNNLLPPEKAMILILRNSNGNQQIIDMLYFASTLILSNIWIKFLRISPRAESMH